VVDSSVAVTGGGRDDCVRLSLLVQDVNFLDLTECAVIRRALVIAVLLRGNDTIGSCLIQHVGAKVDRVVHVEIHFHQEDGTKLVNQRKTGNLLQGYGYPIAPSFRWDATARDECYFVGEKIRYSVRLGGCFAGSIVDARVR
jgi:hypothetical protein